MNRALTVVLLVVALAATGLAVAAGSNVAAAIPAAVLAVLAGAFLLADVVGQTRWPAARRSLPVLPADPAMVRTSIAEGPTGRPSLVLLLDQLERSNGNPNRPNTSVQELQRIHALRPEEFRAYLRARLAAIERGM